MFIPELALVKFVNGLFVHLVRDYNNKSDKDDSIIHKIVGDQMNGKERLIDSAVNLLSRRESTSHSARPISIKLGYGTKQVLPPAIHITSPADTQIMQGIGGGLDGRNVFTNPDGTLNTQVAASFEGQYAIIVHSDNMIECTILYNLLKFSIASFVHSLDFAGFSNPVVTGRDLTVEMREMSGTDPVYTKAVLIKAFTENNIPFMFDKDCLTDIMVTGVAVLNEETDEQQSEA